VDRVRSTRGVRNEYSRLFHRSRSCGLPPVWRGLSCATTRGLNRARASRIRGRAPTSP